MKNIVFSLTVVLVAAISFFSCDDYFETGIEGQWQMRKMIYPDGNENQVDSLFYLFKKDVFKYIKMENDLNSYYIFGTYKENGDVLDISLDPTTLFGNCMECMGWGDQMQRAYTVKKKNSSELILQYADTTYIFRKY